MTNQKLGATRFKMRVTSKSRGALNEAIICGRRVRVCSCTGIIECREYSWGATFFNEVAYNLVIEVFDRVPFYLFPDIFLLFSLEGQFNKDLLKLFIDIIDAELLERVVLQRGQFKRQSPGLEKMDLEYFESENILSSIYTSGDKDLGQIRSPVCQ